jgi:phospholipase/lecithinase/hemolysin
MLTCLYKKILLCIALLAPLPLIAAPYTKLVVFGDSLSDSGNLASLPTNSFLNKPPYKHGFTNGVTAVTHLAKLLGLPLKPSLHLDGTVDGNNFAVAGARAAGNAGIDFNWQLALFFEHYNGKAPADILYVIFLGGNDVRDMRDLPEKAATALLNKATNNIQSALSRLTALGATHFLVVNSPDVGSLPETHALAATGKPNLVRYASQRTSLFNKKLAQTVAQINKKKNVNIVLFDLLSFFKGLGNNGKAYNFNNTQQACYSSAVFQYYPTCDNAKMNSFLFFDEIHPTQRVHERLGRALFSVVPEAN